MKIQRIIWILLFASAGVAKAQLWSDDDIRGRMNLGLKLGLGTGSFFGKELKNPRMMMGFNAGLFFHGKDTLKRLNWQTGLEARFRGGNFNNGYLGNTAYTRIGLITVDLPVLLNIRLGKPRSSHYNTLQLGGIGSYILKSIVYVGDDKTPLEQGSYLKTWSRLPFYRFDYQAVLAYQTRGEFTGFQIALKCSVLDMNNHFVLSGLLPATGTGKFIGTWNLDFGFLF